jgi:hypothetical protein
MSTTARNVRIGLVVTLALLSLMVTLFFIGSNQKLFSRKNEYFVQLETVSGLAEGNPVQLSGVNIGIVRDIRLPQDPKNRQVQITVSVDRKFAERIRGDSASSPPTVTSTSLPVRRATPLSSRDRSFLRQNRPMSISSSVRVRTSSTTSSRSRTR